jgi:chloride channel 7
LSKNAGSGSTTLFKGIPGQLSNGGLLNFGSFDNATYSVYELPLYVLIGVLGGLLGALYNHINYRLTVFRMRQGRTTNSFFLFSAL